jgi:hypothetical protein
LKRDPSTSSMIRLQTRIVIDVFRRANHGLRSG